MFRFQVVVESSPKTLELDCSYGVESSDPLASNQDQEGHPCVALVVDHLVASSCVIVDRLSREGSP